MSSRITHEVLSAAQAGDGAAMSVIYRETAPAILGYLTAKGVSDPEGVTSDVFLAFLPRLPALTGGPAGLRTLLFSIAHARMVDHHRSRSRRPDPVEFEPELDRRATDSAEQTALTALSTDLVVDLLGELSDDQREVLVLRLVADLTVDQVAEVLDKSPGAVKQHQRRGLIALRELMRTRQVTL
ncbi:sigma-70 family RNA polymerase sigma factor [soil metagenome]